MPISKNCKTAMSGDERSVLGNAKERHFNGLGCGNRGERAEVSAIVTCSVTFTFFFRSHLFFIFSLRRRMRIIVAVREDDY